MIAVIADDFTGAAEIGGVGLRYGLRVVIETQVNRVKDADLIVIATETRTLSEKDSYNEIEKVTTLLLKQKPRYIFKKLDSVLRGNIAAEIEAQLKITGKKRAIMVAGNPEFGRTIEKGTYFIDRIPLAETSFAKDPDFPVHSSIVTDIIKSEELNVNSFSAGSEIPECGIIIGEVKDKKEMELWAEKIDRHTVVAGGAGYFDMLMSKKYQAVNTNHEGCLRLGAHTLFIFGSKYPKDKCLPMGLQERDTVKLNMPDGIYENYDFDYQLLLDWAKQIVENLKAKKNVIVTVEQGGSTENNLEERIRQNVADVVKLVSREIQLTDLLIEGGATTSEILKAIGINKLFPNKLVREGIIQMNTKEYPNLTITTKPGSYPWPDNVVLMDNCEKDTNKL